MCAGALQLQQSPSSGRVRLASSPLRLVRQWRELGWHSLCDSHTQYTCGGRVESAGWKRKLDEIEDIEWGGKAGKVLARVAKRML